MHEKWCCLATSLHTATFLPVFFLQRKSAPLPLVPRFLKPNIYADHNYILEDLRCAEGVFLNAGVSTKAVFFFYCSQRRETTTFPGTFLSAPVGSPRIENL